MSDTILKLHEAIKIQQCVDSMADSVKQLTIFCNEFSNRTKEILPDNENRVNYQLLNVNKVAEILACSRPMVYKLLYDGKIRSIRLGKRCIRITEESLKFFLDENIILPSDTFSDGMLNDEMLKVGAAILVPNDSANYNELAGEELIIVSVVIKGVYAKKWDEPGKGLFLPHGEFVLLEDRDLDIHGI